MSVSGHKSESSIKHYSYVDEAKKRRMSRCLSSMSDGPGQSTSTAPSTSGIHHTTRNVITSPGPGPGPSRPTPSTAALVPVQHTEETASSQNSQSQSYHHK